MTLEELTTKIILAMIRQGLSQNKLAKMVGVKTSTISRFLNGQTNPSYTLVVDVCKALKIRVVI